MYSLFFSLPIHITEAPLLNFLGAVVTCKACKDNAQCSCTQANFDDLRSCLNCYKAVVLKFAPESDEEDAKDDFYNYIYC